METNSVNTLYPQRDCHNYKYLPQVPARKIKGHSMTIPDQAMSIREIMARFTRMPEALANGVDPKTAYYDETERPNFDTLDLVDREQLREAFSEELQAIQKRYTDASTKKEKEALRNEIKAQMEKEAQENKKSDENPPK